MYVAAYHEETDFRSAGTPSTSGPYPCPAFMVSSRVLVIGALLFAHCAFAETIGKVIGISDGDTLTVLVERQQVKVRLVEIDAPEKAQAFGNKSKQSLSTLCFKKTAKLDDKGKDRYGRTLARVHCDGIDANAEQVRHGMAWVYDRYVTDRSLYGLQDEARAAKRGLWADPSPMPPWEWRH
ncbi:MAG: thermonuclease family protein [Rhodocyclaceae bacterium]